MLSENAEANARLQSSLSEKLMEKEGTEAKIAALEIDRTQLLEVSGMFGLLSADIHYPGYGV